MANGNELNTGNPFSNARSVTNQLNDTKAPMPQSWRQTATPMTSPNQANTRDPVVPNAPIQDFSGNQFANNNANAGGMSYQDALGQVAPNLLMGGLQTAVGLGGLLTQGDVPQYSQPDRLQTAYDEYGRIAQHGIPEVLQSADQRLARSTQTGRQEAMDQAGPSTANAINAAMTSQNLEGQRQIAEMEQNQMMKGLQNQLSVAEALRGDELNRTQAARDRYGQEEAAFGKAAQSGMHNMTNAFNLATGLANTAGGNPMGAMQGLQGLMGLLNSQ